LQWANWAGSATRFAIENPARTLTSPLRPCHRHFRFWPILLQNDFGCPRKQHCFEMRRRCARLIQRFAGCDPIVAHELPLADFCNNIGPQQRGAAAAFSPVLVKADTAFPAPIGQPSETCERPSKRHRCQAVPDGSASPGRCGRAVNAANAGSRGARRAEAIASV